MARLVAPEAAREVGFEEAAVALVGDFDGKGVTSTVLGVFSERDLAVVLEAEVAEVLERLVERLEGEEFVMDKNQ